MNQIRAPQPRHPERGARFRPYLNLGWVLFFSSRSRGMTGMAVSSPANFVVERTRLAEPWHDPGRRWARFA